MAGEWIIKLAMFTKYDNCLESNWQKLIYENSFTDIYFYQEDDGDDADGSKINFENILFTVDMYQDIQTPKSKTK